MKRWLRILLLLGGVTLLGALAARADWPAIRGVYAQLGWLAPLALLPYLAVYAIDTAAWATTLPPERRPAFRRLFRLRWAGEAVNNLVPTGYIGGEAVKVYLLRNHGVSTADGTVAAVVSKTAQTLAQVGFVTLGALLFARLTPGQGAIRIALFSVAAAGLSGVVAFLALQRRGLATVLLGTLDRLRIRIRALDRRRERLVSVDREIRTFYTRARGRFLLSTGLFFAGWLLDAVEIYVVGHWMGVSIGGLEALAIEAFIGVAKIVGLLVPGAVGVQESGVVMLCRLAGLPEHFGYAYALWRRCRELLYAGVGWAFLTREQGRFRGQPPSHAVPEPGYRRGPG